MDSNINSEPWWWQDAPPRQLPHTEVAAECDVAIVGAGFTGLTAALFLAKAGKSVQVFEKDRPGEGASTRNGGITSGSIRISPAQAIAAHGEARGLGLFREANDARKFLRTLIEENGIDCDYALTGLFSGSLTQKDFEAQKRAVALAEEKLGLSQVIVEKQALSSVTGSSIYVGGVLNPDVGTIQPAKLVAGLLDAATGAGAQVHGQTPVTGIEPEGSGYRIRTDRGDCQAGEVVFATNGYTDAANQWLRRRLIPVKSRIIVTEELPPNLIASLIPDMRAMAEVRKLYQYFRQTPDGRRILIGGREPPWKTGEAAAVGRIRTELHRIYPELKDYAITHSWAGNVAFNRSYLPAMFSHKGMHHAVGYCGSGTVWAPWLGYKTAMKILGDSRAASHFETTPPKSVPFYNGTPWFLPFMIAGYGIEDRLRGRR